MRTPLPIAILGLALLSSCQPSAPAPASGPAGPAGAPSANAGGPAGPGGPPGQGAPGGRSRSAVVPVQVETVKFGPLVVQNNTGGTVAAETQSSVAAGTTGTVLNLVKKAGDWVEPGETVIRLDDRQLQLSLKIAQKSLENTRVNAGVLADGSRDPNSKLQLQVNSAQKSYDSAVSLAKIGGISGSDLDTAKANLQAAKDALNQNDLAVSTAELQVQQAQLNLQFTAIKAPYAGQIVIINVHPGEYVTASTAVFVLASRAKIVNFNVPPSDAVGLNSGAHVQFVQGGQTWPVRLTGAPSAPVNGQVPLTAALPANFPGTFGTVGAVQYSQVLATGVLAPLTAIQTLENSTYVFVVKDNKAARADVTILANSGNYAAVSGLTDGATVILSPPPGLLVGAPVQVLAAKAAGPGATPPQAQGAPGPKDAGAAPNGQRKRRSAEPSTGGQ